MNIQKLTDDLIRGLVIDLAQTQGKIDGIILLAQMIEQAELAEIEESNVAYSVSAGETAAAAEADCT
jgi:hypothetical protein